MDHVQKIRETPEPVSHNGREHLPGGWNTAAVAKWLISQKNDECFVSLSEIASFAYHRDSQSNRERVKHNISPLRRFMASSNEFLLVQYGYQRRVEALKVCNFLDANDRQMATEQLTTLEARGEVTLTEANRWRDMLYLPRVEA